MFFEHTICLLIDFINEAIDFIHQKKMVYYEQIAYICVINSTTSYVW